MDSLKNLQILLSSMDSEHLTKSDFDKKFEQVLRSLIKIKEALESKIENKKKDLENMFSDLKNEIDNFKGDTGSTLKSDVDKAINDFTRKLYAKISEIDSKLLEVKDGEDADEERVISEVLNRLPELLTIPKIDDLKNDIPSLAFPIRDSLELIQKEEDKLKIDAIGYLREELDELKKLRQEKTLGGGGFNYGSLDIHIVDDETPSGTINGANKVFTIANTPSPASSLKVYLDGQRMKLTTDYTFSGTTITFVDAPLTNSILTVDYRV